MRTGRVVLLLGWVIALGVAGEHALASGLVAPKRLGLGEALGPLRLQGHETGHRLIHFTFDDGPDAHTTPKLLEALDREGVKATFFFSASRFRGREKRNAHARPMALEVLRRGHGIGSHSVDHARMGAMSPAQLRAQLEESDRLFVALFGTKTYLFRPPWGSANAALEAMMAERRDTLVFWNLGMADWVRRPASELKDSFLRRLDHAERVKGERGGIVLMHDTHEWSVEAFPLIVAALRARNCELYARGEELYDIVDDLRPWQAVAGHESESDAKRGMDAAEIAERQKRLRADAAARCAEVRRAP